MRKRIVDDSAVSVAVAMSKGDWQKLCGAIGVVIPPLAGSCRAAIRTALGHSLLEDVTIVQQSLAAWCSLLAELLRFPREPPTYEIGARVSAQVSRSYFTR